jgi:hypothetical protein
MQRGTGRGDSQIDIRPFPADQTCSNAISQIVPCFKCGTYHILSETYAFARCLLDDLCHKLVSKTSRHSKYPHLREYIARFGTVDPLIWDSCSHPGIALATDRVVNHMRYKIKIVSGLMGLVILAALVQVSDGQNRTVLNEAERISGDQFSVITRTSSGASVYAVNKPNTATLNAIDQGLTELFAVARKNGYQNHLNYRDYTIYIGRADRTKDSAGQYSPDIAIPAAQYAGTVYDKGGYIYAAGIVVALNPSAFLIAEHTRDYERVSTAVRNEGEHLVLYQNDRKRYAETADHSRGGGHPILQ